MVKRTLKLTGALLFALLILLATAGGWLLGSNSGARWLLNRADSLDAIEISAEIKGSIWAGLELTDLRVAWPNGEIITDRALYSWTPQALWRTEIAIDRLEIGVTRIIFSAAKTTPAVKRPPKELADLFWPLLPDWLLNSQVSIGKLVIDEISFLQESADPQTLADLRGSFSLTDGLFIGEQLHLRFVCGEVDGSIHLNLSEQQLGADLIWRGSRFLADWDTLHIVTSLDNQFTGPLAVTALAKTSQRLDLNAEAALTLSGLNLAELAIKRSDRPDLVTGSLMIDWRDAFRLAADLQLTHLDLEPEAGWPTDLSGTVVAELTVDGYAGTVDLISFRPGLEQGKIAATVNGDWGGLQLSDLQADWLQGELNGTLTLDWQEGFRLTGDLQGKKINLAAVVAGMDSELQLSARGGLQVSPAGALSAEWKATLGPSRLQNRPLEGEIAGRWEEEELQITALDLRGDGLLIKGAGRLSQRINLQIEIASLGTLGKEWRGSVTGDGWLAHRNREWLYAAQGELKNIHFDTIQADAGHFRLDSSGPLTDSHLDLFLTGLSLPQGRVDELALRGSGQIGAHELNLRLAWPTGSATTTASGSWENKEWSAQILTFAGDEKSIGNWEMAEPTRITLSSEQLSLTRLQLNDEQGGTISVSADILPRPRTGTLQADWDNLSLEYLNPWLSELSVQGKISGALQFQAFADGSIQLSAEALSAPTLQYSGEKLVFNPSHARLDWGGDGLDATAELNLATGGGLNLTLQSAETGRMALPEQGALAIDWDAIDLQQLTPWLPRGLALKGVWQGALNGSWQKGAPLLMDGKTTVDAGSLQWQERDGIITLPLRQVELTGKWETAAVTGKLTLLTEQGEITGEFRLPTDLNNLTAPLHAKAHFELHELGLLALLMPGVTNETFGVMQGDLRLAGTWKKPLFFGNFSLREASADIPALGLKLRKFELDATFNDSLLELKRLQLQSGKGELHGDGELQLSGWKPQRWQLNLKGENVQLLHLPEVTLEATPDLQLSGTAGIFKLRGDLLIPTLLVNEVPKNAMIEPSDDVIIIGATEPSATPLFKKLDVNVKLRLGEYVVVDARGLDARLEGDVIIATDRRGAFFGQGEIRVAQGHYATYGLKLPITRGRAIFSGGALQDPTLDVLAQRTVGEVKAGVHVTGTPRKPLVKLVSDPSLPDTEILSYIVLGRPLGTGGGQNDTLMLAAGALLSRGESAALQEKLKRQLGIDVLAVESSGSDGVEGSVIAAGKYITPELYLSFSQSLFTPESVAKLRYQIDKHWEIQSQFGTISGADLSYKIEFR